MWLTVVKLRCIKLCASFFSGTPCMILGISDSEALNWIRSVSKLCGTVTGSCRPFQRSARVHYHLNISGDFSLLVYFSSLHCVRSLCVQLLSVIFSFVYESAQSTFVHFCSNLKLPSSMTMINITWVTSHESSIIQKDVTKVLYQRKDVAIRVLLFQLKHIVSI